MDGTGDCSCGGPGCAWCGTIGGVGGLDAGSETETLDDPMRAHLESHLQAHSRA
jgi:hypothetical protein